MKNNSNQMRILNPAHFIEDYRLPWGFKYTLPPYSDANPDPVIERVRLREEFLNRVIELCPGYKGHVIATALKLLQENSNKDVQEFWAIIQSNCTEAEVAEMANALAQQVADTLPLINFPYTIALFDCRFVSTEEWQHIRRYSIGGSEAAAVVGVVDENGDQVNGYTQLSKYQTRRSVFFAKDPTIPEEENSPGKAHIFSYGHAVEPFVIQKAATLLNAVVWPEHRMFCSAVNPCITCNPDGILYFPEADSFCLFEAKTATYHKKDEWHEGIPAYYVPQPRQYLEVLNDPRFAHGYIGCCLGAGKYDWEMHRYERNKTLGKKQIEIEVKFWQDYIEAGILPPLSGNAELDKEDIYRSMSTFTVSANSDNPLPANCADLFQEYSDLEKKRKALSKQQRAIKAEEDFAKTSILAAVPDGITVVSAPGQPVFRISLTKSPPESVDILALHQSDPTAYMQMLAMAEALAEDDGVFGNPKVIA